LGGDGGSRWWFEAKTTWDAFENVKKGDSKVSGFFFSIKGGGR